MISLKFQQNSQKIRRQLTQAKASLFKMNFKVNVKNRRKLENKKNQSQLQEAAMEAVFCYTLKM